MDRSVLHNYVGNYSVITLVFTCCNFRLLYSLSFQWGEMENLFRHTSFLTLPYNLQSRCIVLSDNICTTQVRQLLSWIWCSLRVNSALNLPSLRTLWIRLCDLLLSHQLRSLLSGHLEVTVSTMMRTQGFMIKSQFLYESFLSLWLHWKVPTLLSSIANHHHFPNLERESWRKSETNLECVAPQDCAVALFCCFRDLVWSTYLNHILSHFP